MKIALCQMANAGKPAANLEKSIRAIKEAAENGADLILFPEVQLTEFFPQYPGQDVTQYRISLDSEVVTAFCRAAQENGILVVPNILLYENREDIRCQSADSEGRHDCGRAEDGAYCAGGAVL